jgi:DNA-binding response OmpR family regulator
MADAVATWTTGERQPLQDHGDGPVPYRVRRTRILVVEDHAELQRALRINLRARLYDVIAARAGREALALSHGQLPHHAVIGRWQVDLASHRVTRADSAAAPTDSAAAVQLTPTEWAILTLLLQRPGQLVGSAQLLTGVWGPGFQQRTNYLRFHMARLRRKLEDNPARPCHLLTEPGMGYRYQPQPC